MNIDDLTIGQAKELTALFGGGRTTVMKNADYGLVVCQFIGRFVFVANMRIEDGFCVLKNVKNVRYWKERENGLGDLAAKGPISGDKIDSWPNQLVPVDKLGPFMPASPEYWP